MTAALHNANDVAEWLKAAAPAAQLSADSRIIEAGDVFFAFAGDGAAAVSTDGRRYIGDAIARGAKAVVYDPDGFDWPGAADFPHCPVAGLTRIAGPIANLHYGQPDAGMTTIAVTGTNGKTSCTQWLANAISRLCDPTAVVGTLGAGIYVDGKHDAFGATGYTTPDAVQLQRRLAALRKGGANALAIEASSIGLEEARLDGMHIDIAVFTNLTRDHLDYHGDMQAYEAAKQRLFAWPGLKHAVVNLDDEAGLRLVDFTRRHAPQAKITGYTLKQTAVDGIDILRASDIRNSHGGTVFHLHSGAAAQQVRAQMVGRFNVSNLLAVIGAMLARDISLHDAIEAAEELTPVPGRMEQLGGQDAPLVVIDYAHTPDALEKTLMSLREVASERGGQLWCVFGCGGDRDPGKRPQMGAAATAADHVIVTSDNPRSEEPKDIIAQIAAGMRAEKGKHMEIEDRAAAILWAIRHAARHDVVLLAGKGHETYQEIKGKKLPFLDADHAALALAARATMRGAA